MKFLPFINRINSNKDHQHPLQHTDSLFDNGHSFYCEDYFNKLLCTERKRTERTKKPILLMLIDIEEVTEIVEKNQVIKNITSVIFSSTREIDIKGWYKSDFVIGIIFTELNGICKNGKIRFPQEIHNNLCKTLGLEQMKKVSISYHLFPEEYDEHKPDSTLDFKLYPDLLKHNSYKKKLFFVKRIIDTSGSILSLIAFSPFFVVISLLIKFSSEGPILFRQERVGIHGEKFTFLKFRTMYDDPDCNVHKEFVKEFITGQKGNGNIKGSNKDEVYKLKYHPRVTSIGKFLRRTSLDEFPQFINVLKGEMSLVGPRPPIPYEIKAYDLWHRHRVFEMRPGITGLWQVKGRSATTFDEMVRMDLKYTREWSLWLDFKLLLETPLAVLTCKGAH
jgi:lipopolysaccharide/colanic/teichoic acid biosynthesis glycosyltransferase